MKAASATLRLLKSRAVKANPKKSFQLLVRYDIFLHIATIYHRIKITSGTFHGTMDESAITLFHEFISDAFFHLDHHMDGFRSLQLQIPSALGDVRQDNAAATGEAVDSNETTTKPSFHCYQEGLLTILNEFVVGQTPGHTANGANDKSLIAVANFESFLVDAFMAKAAKLQNHKSTRKKNPVDKLGQLQFQIVSCLTGDLLIRFFQSCGGSSDDKDETRAAILSAVAKNLELVLRYNVYQPTVNKSIEKNFLHEIAKGIMDCMIFKKSKDGEDAIEALENVHEPKMIQQYAFAILEILLKLDHAVVHDHLKSILTWCLAHDSDAVDDPVVTRKNTRISLGFVVTTVKTYGKLRQLDYFYECFNSSICNLSSSMDIERLQNLHAVVMDDEIVHHLRDANYQSPIQQVKKIFARMKNAIMDVLRLEALPRINLAVAMVTELLTGLLRDIRINASTHSEILELVNEVMHGSVCVLMRKDHDDFKTTTSDFVSVAISISAWALDAILRCSFWVNGDKMERSTIGRSDFPVLSSILRILDDVILDKISFNDTQYDHRFKKGIQFFACQRIKQLHMEMFTRQKVAYASDSESYNWQDETSEARTLATFVLNGVFYDNHELSTSNYTSWLALADAVHIWSPHADTKQADLFLKFFFQVLSTVQKASLQGQKDVALLLQDASFYEAANIYRRLGLNAVLFVAKRLTKTLACYGKVPRKVTQFVHPILEEDGKSSDLSELFYLYSETSKWNLKHGHEATLENLLQQAVVVMEFVNGVQLSVWEKCDDYEKVLESLLRTDAICCAVLFAITQRSGTFMMMRLICYIRLGAARILERQGIKKLMSQQASSTFNIVIPIVRNAGTLFDLAEEDSIQLSLITSCSNLFSAAFKSSLFSNKQASSLVEMLLETWDVSAINGLNTILIACTIKIFKGVRLSAITMDVALSKQAIKMIRDFMWGYSQEVLFSQEQSGSLTWKLSLKLVAEGLLLSSNCGQVYNLFYLSLGEDFFEGIMAMLSWELSPSVSKSISYLVCCLGPCIISENERQQLVEKLTMCYINGNQSFKTPLCSVVNALTPTELSIFLGKMFRDAGQQEDTDTTRAALCLTLVLTLTNHIQVQVLSEHSISFLSVGLAVMNHASKADFPHGEGVLTASSLILELSNRREIYTFRERDIALILSSISATLMGNVSFANEQLTKYRIRAFEACYTLTSSFLQRFAKQVHSCVPLLISTMLMMLQFVLYAPLSETVMVECGQKFCRICELLLPYGDVYKKHILCLIIEFVKGIGSDLHTVRKESLLTGIYCLLDIIQEHETQQLNAMLDDMGRALLSTIYDGYKKHIYKGQ
jgi:hypothetical protein